MPKTKNIEIKEDKKENNNDIKKFQEEINNLTKIINEKNNKIHSMEKQINDINFQYKNDLLSKSKEAQDQLNEKINTFKNKMNDEIKDIKKYAIKDNAVELIEIINQFSNVVNTPINNPEVQNYIVGFKMFSNMFDSLLHSMNIEKISIKENDLFNEKNMEAVDVEINSSKPENTIFKIIKNGYKLYDQILIYSQVIVYKKK